MKKLDATLRTIYNLLEEDVSQNLNKVSNSFVITLAGKRYRVSIDPCCDEAEDEDYEEPTKPGEVDTSQKITNSIMQHKDVSAETMRAKQAVLNALRKIK